MPREESKTNEHQRDRRCRRHERMIQINPRILILSQGEFKAHYLLHHVQRESTYCLKLTEKIANDSSLKLFTHENNLDNKVRMFDVMQNNLESKQLKAIMRQ